LDWLRLWHDLPTDPKWRSIARASQQRIGDVIAVFIQMLVCASKAEPRGMLFHWSDEDAGSTIDLEADAVTAIRNAMQGRVLEGDRLIGWEKRQRKREREDDSTERVKEYRDRQKEPCNATKRHVTPPDEIQTRREEKIKDDDVAQRTDVSSNRFLLIGGIMHGYMRMTGTPYEREWPAPDAHIVSRCVAATNGAPLNEIQAHLRKLAEKQSPRQTNGPEGYAWFERVFRARWGGGR
jgi:hypothetical protein